MQRICIARYMLWPGVYPSVTSSRCPVGAREWVELFAAKNLSSASKITVVPSETPSKTPNLVDCFCFVRHCTSTVAGVINLVRPSQVCHTFNYNALAVRHGQRRAVPLQQLRLVFRLHLLIAQSCESRLDGCIAWSICTVANALSPLRLI